MRSVIYVNRKRTLGRVNPPDDCRDNQPHNGQDRLDHDEDIQPYSVYNRHDRNTFAPEWQDTRLLS